LDVATNVVFYADDDVMTVAKNWYIGFLFCIVFSLFSWFLYCHVALTHSHCDIDSKAYLERGLLFAQTGRFVTATSPEQPYYALGYAGIIGILYRVLWPSVVFIILIQLLLAYISCFMMMRCSRLLFGACAAWWVAVFCAISLGYLVFVQFVLTEVVLSFFLLLSFERLLTWLTYRASLYPLATAAFVLGLSIAIKPAALYSFFILVPLIGSVTGTLRQRIGRIFIFAICFYLPIGGYMTYNYHAFGNFRVSTLDRVNLYYWFYPNVLAQLHGTTSDAERLHLLARSQGAHNFAAVENLFWHSLQDHPLTFMYVWGKNVIKTFAGLYTTNLKVLVAPSVHGGGISFFKTSGTVITRVWAYITVGAYAPWVTVVGCCEVVWSLLRYLLCCVALVGLVRCKKMLPALLCCAYIAYFSLITGHDGCARFRMMFEFLLIILAAGGITIVYRAMVKTCTKIKFVPFVWFDIFCSQNSQNTHHERVLSPFALSDLQSKSYRRVRTQL
jgi:4-amino-4-deoxy-L-arabinose transferase-like glycosyltransferase